MSRKLLAIGFVVSSLSVLHGCASTTQRAEVEQKISQAIGEEVKDFKITERTEGVSAPAGFSEGLYDVRTTDGKHYRCSVMEPSGFMNVMSFGGAGSAAAMCTDFTKGSKQQGKTNAPSCNDLLRAAGKC